MNPHISFGVSGQKGPAFKFLVGPLKASKVPEFPHTLLAWNSNTRKEKTMIPGRVISGD